MKSLVYDFGQLDTATEQEYTIKIIEKHVSQLWTIALSLLMILYSCMA